MFRTLRHRIAATATALATAAAGVLLGAAPAAPAETAVPATIPLQITNNSGRAEPVYVYNLGTELWTGRQGWADASGTSHAWPAGGVPPVPAPDASIAGPAPGGTTTIRVPKPLRGGIYFSPTDASWTSRAGLTGGLVQPAVQNPS
ncbi:Sugar hydrolase OS=Streptomyces fumanus OX=67302 GN=GCM10018772_26960 PE=4 SV=1 [Streptomyces fumanus]